MFKKRDEKEEKKQLEKKPQFIIEINPENRWVKLAKMMPWEKIEEQYALSMCGENGRMGKTSRIAFGSIYAKEQEKITDEEMVEQIKENAYIQYFLGLEGYESGALFDSSMMVHFRRRFGVEFIEKVNEYIGTGKWPEEEEKIQTVEKLPEYEEKITEKSKKKPKK